MADMYCLLILQDNLYSWMSDRLGRDQFVIKAGEETLISWNDGKRGRSEEVGRTQDSPLGPAISACQRGEKKKGRVSQGVSPTFIKSSIETPSPLFMLDAG